MRWRGWGVRRRRLEKRGWREKARGKGVEGDERREGRGLISMDIHDG